MAPRDWTGQLLRVAIERNDLEEFKRLVPQRRSLWPTAIREAVTMGRTQMVRYLVEQGVKVTAGLLQLAVEYGRVNVVSYLVGQGLKPSASDVNTAAILGHYYVVEYFASYHWWPDQPAIDLTARHGHLAVLQYLVKHRRHHGHFPSAYAVEGAIDFGRRAVAQYLIELDVLPSQLYIDLALSKGQFSVIEALAEKGRYPSDEGRTWLTRALTRRQLEPSVEALNYALEHNMLEAVQFLIEAGVWTSSFMLSVPVHHGYLELVKYLVGVGVVYHPNLLEVAIRRGHPAVFEVLYRHGVPLTKWNLMLLAVRDRPATTSLGSQLELAVPGRHLEAAAQVLRSMGEPYPELRGDELVLVPPDDPAQASHVAWASEFPDPERPWTWEPPVDF